MFYVSDSPHIRIMISFDSGWLSVYPYLYMTMEVLMSELNNVMARKRLEFVSRGYSNLIYSTLSQTDRSIRNKLIDIANEAIKKSEMVIYGYEPEQNVAVEPTVVGDEVSQVVEKLMDADVPAAELVDVVEQEVKKPARSRSRSKK